MPPRPASPSQSDNEADIPATEISLKVSVQLTEYTSGTTAGGKKKLVKETKTKELEHTFEASKKSYLGLLTTMLVKFGLARGFTVSENALYVFKVQIPPAPLRQSTDIENYNEYITSVVEKVLESPPSKPITIFIDVKKIKAAKKRANDDSDSEDSGEDDGKTGHLTATERAIVEQRGLLEREYGDPNTNACFYTCPQTKEKVPLTFFMMAEWARAMVDKKATLLTPPDTITFDPRTRNSSLLGRDRRSSSVSSGSLEGVSRAATSDLGHLSAILGMVLGTHQLETPHPSLRASTPPPPRSEPLTLTIKTHQQSCLDSFNMPKTALGPEVLNDIGDQHLTDLNIAPGNVIRLRRAAGAWVTSDHLTFKRKSPEEPEPDPRPSKKTVLDLEKCLTDAAGNEVGIERVYGSMRQSEGEGSAYVDELGLTVKWFFRVDGMDGFAPVPPGWSVSVEND
ncbi:hypothetical protein D9758_019096 [Tetrapyrgos nigripes]|uniref:Uncharacterized protein n=1 Tax=Tetrapyrgos nigripes TaxID=182062 RepID=A0A8H5FHR3_9AGAR|nr:hypothetical protein D9758_019096 [Tetrapyrgos nigripes]